MSTSAAEKRRAMSSAGARSVFVTMMSGVMPASMAAVRARSMRP
ncbi:Uncharacterised protein [Mycobacteroides abscessus subsp. abscessus]|nr:Uncharacterised protein [Mycobacteroides abscessus subsp. abscessus]